MSDVPAAPKVQYCLICKYNPKNEQKLKASTREVLYLYNNRHFPLHLCYRHSVEYFLKGQVMKLSKGKANPGVAGEILERKLKG